jgi:hypothetical protein
MSIQRYGLLIAVTCLSLQARAAEGATVSIALHARSACVTPHAKHFARAEGSFIDAQITDTGALVANLSACVAANAFLGHTGMAIDTLELEQQVEFSSSDPQVSTCTLTLDSTLIGYLRSKHRASACVRVATVALTPLAGGESLIAASYPESCVSGGDGRLCNQRLASVVVPKVPLGKYILSAQLVVEVQAGGIYDAHSAADFSPSAALPQDFVRLRDPFQNTDKKNFGFTMILTAAAPGQAAPRSSDGEPVTFAKKRIAAPANRVTGAAFQRARAAHVD